MRHVIYIILVNLLFFVLLAGCQRSGESGQALESSAITSQNIEAYTSESQPVEINVTQMLSLDENNSILTQVSTHGEHGKVSLMDGGKLLYSPEEGFIGQDRFQSSFAAKGDKSATVDVLVNVLPFKPTFAEPFKISLGVGNQNFAHAAIAGDFNNDHKPDIVVENTLSGDYFVSILNRTEKNSMALDFGELKEDLIIKSGVGISEIDSLLATGDFNADDLADLIIPSIGYGFTSIILNKSGSDSDQLNFAAPINISGNNSTAVTVGDFNLDGLDDFAVSNFYDDTVSVFANTTKPKSDTVTFTPYIELSGHQGSAFYGLCIAKGDFNLDGLPDIALTTRVGLHSQQPGILSVYLNQTTLGQQNLSFAEKIDFATQAEPASIRVDDMNLDGLPDVIIANRDSESVIVLINQTPIGSENINFSEPVVLSLPTTSLPVALAIGDLNRDGRMDIVVGNYYASNIAIFLNKTSRQTNELSFAFRIDIPMPGYHNTSVGIDDFNQDGLPDLLVTQEELGIVSVLLNTSLSK